MDLFSQGYGIRGMLIEGDNRMRYVISGGQTWQPNPYV